MRVLRRFLPWTVPLALAIAVFLPILEALFRGLTSVLASSMTNYEQFLGRFLARLFVAFVLLNAFLFSFVLRRLALQQNARAAYKSFYDRVQGEDGTTYRVNCYKFYKWNSFAWWWCFFLHLFNPSRWCKRRFMRWGYSALLCLARYGHEDGKRVVKPTTLVFHVDLDEDLACGFAGNVLIADDHPVEAIDNSYEINSIIKKVRPSLATLPRDMLSPVANDLAALEKDRGALKGLEESEAEMLLAFMRNTNTNLHLLLSVHKIAHCNHFVGFKIYDHRQQLWGVVTIDARDTHPFDEICVGPTRSSSDFKSWRAFLLTSFRNFFTATLR